MLIGRAEVPVPVEDVMSGITPVLDGQWRVLSEQQIDQIHEATLHILGPDGCGVVFKSEAARSLLKKHGASVEGETVKFPARMVEHAIESSPAEVILGARNPLRNVILGRGNIHYTSGFGPTDVIDLDDGHLRPATTVDLERFAILADALDNVHYCLLNVHPQDVPQSSLDVVGAATYFKTTDKHVHVSQNDARNTAAILRMARVAAEDAGVTGPICSMGGCPTSPLVYMPEVCDKFFAAIPYGVPFLIVSGAMAGGTAPVTLAGTLVVQNAEVLAGVVLAQLIRPGAPVVYGTFASNMDMRHGTFVLGGPELALINAATAQLCRRYGIPLGYGSAGFTDSRQPGIQAAVEKASTMLAAALSGVEVLHSAIGGLLASAAVADYAQMMIDDEIATLVNRYIAGIAVTPESLAASLIERIGPGGTFVDAIETARSFRREHFIPKILERGAACMEDENLYARAKDRARRILSTHVPPRISEGAAREIDRLLSEAVRGD